MNRSPLHNLHVKWGAKLVDFAGWSMPLMYRSIIEEHNHTRQACSLFDVSHMGRIEVTGAEAEAFLQRLCTRNLTGMEPGVSRYSHICRDDGGILDDVIVSRFKDIKTAGDRWLIVCNAANHDKILAWLGQHAPTENLMIDDQTLQTAMVAFQGPEAIGVVERMLNVELGDLKPFHFKVQFMMTFPCVVFRSGYTGEDGVEIILPTALIKLVLPAILGAGDDKNRPLRPAGLAARDTLRIEAGMPLYGHELTEKWNPLTAGQSWCVDLDKDFIGAEAIGRVKKAGTSCQIAGRRIVGRRIVGLELCGRRTARNGARVLDQGGSPVGTVTSGALSPTLGKSIAMALVNSDHTKPGTQLVVDISGKNVPATVVKLPFYKRHKEKRGERSHASTSTG